MPTQLAQHPENINQNTVIPREREPSLRGERDRRTYVFVVNAWTSALLHLVTERSEARAFAIESLPQTMVGGPHNVIFVVWENVKLLSIAATNSQHPH
jgi:hypothetical protein